MTADTDLTPVDLGEIVTISAQVEHIGRASLEVGVEVHSEQPRTGIRRKTTSSHLAFIALDEHERPRPVGQAIAPASPAEEAVLAAAAARRAARIARVRAGAAGAVPALADDPAGRGVRLARLVMPEDAISGTLMFAGRLLAVLDEVAAITVIRYCRLPTVTASGTTTITSGQSATLTTATTGGVTGYQWYIGNSGDTSNQITGATSSSTNVSPSVTTNYWVKVTGQCGTFNSPATTVTVSCTPIPFGGPLAACRVALAGDRPAALRDATSFPVSDWELFSDRAHRT